MPASQQAGTRWDAGGACNLAVWILRLYSIYIVNRVLFGFQWFVMFPLCFEWVYVYARS